MDAIDPQRWLEDPDYRRGYQAAAMDEYTARTAHTPGDNLPYPDDWLQPAATPSAVQALAEATQAALGARDWALAGKSGLGGVSGPAIRDPAPYVPIPVDGSWLPYQGGALQLPAQNAEGRWRLTAMTYLHLAGVSGNTASLFFTVTAKWASGAPVTIRVTQFGRLTISQQAEEGRIAAVAQAWVDNRPGDSLIYSGAGQRPAGDGVAAVAQIGGQYRLTHEWWPGQVGDPGIVGGWFDYSSVRL